MEDFPLCFYSKEKFETWVKFAESIPDGNDPRLSFCNYCTKGYQKEMTLVDRCQSPDFEIPEGDESWD